jgi:ABC-type Fe3+-citrate transport system substrate-binding protein
MKSLSVLCLALSLATVFTAGCDCCKSATDVKKTETTVTTPEGSTTVTDTQKVETKGDDVPPTDAK